MSINLSIKNVPDELAERLRQQAARHHRSLQGELMAMLEEHLAASAKLSPDEVLRQVKEIGLRTPREATATIRADRNAR